MVFPALSIRFFTLARNFLAVEDYADDKTNHQNIQPKQKDDYRRQRAVQFAHIAKS